MKHSTHSGESSVNADRAGGRRGSSLVSVVSVQQNLTGKWYTSVKKHLSHPESRAITGLTTKSAIRHGAGQKIAIPPVSRASTGFAQNGTGGAAKMRISLQNMRVKIRELTVECGLQRSFLIKTAKISDIHHKSTVRLTHKK